MADGKIAAKAIDLALSKEDRFFKLFSKFNYACVVPSENKVIKKQEGRKLEIKKRRNNFKEVSLGLSGKQADLEAHRCLRCDVKD